MGGNERLPPFLYKLPPFSPLQNPRNSGLPHTFLSPLLSTATVMPPVPPKNETRFCDNIQIKKQKNRTYNLKAYQITITEPELQIRVLHIREL